MRRWSAGVAILLTLAGCGSPTQEQTDRLPQVVLQELGGDGARTGSIDLGEPAGHRVLNLWATWCAPCRHELPAFDQVATELASAGSQVEIIGVNVGDSGPDAAGLLAELGVDFRQILDPTAQVQRALEISGLPATVVVDGAGNVLDVHHGALTAPELRDLIDASVGE